VNPDIRPPYSIREAAEILGIGSRKLFEWLRTERVLDASNIPRQAPVAAGHMTTHRGKYQHPIRGERETMQPRVTYKGIGWLRGRLTEAGLIDAADTSETIP